MPHNLIPKDIDMTVFDAPINGRCWKQDCLRRDDLLLMLEKGNKLGYMSFLRQLVNEMLQFRSAAALEERRQRGQGICLLFMLFEWQYKTQDYVNVPLAQL
uniref:DNA helicase n=1 Tax=Globodera pallida TaxID=36090 RepID=A0A183CMG7_GLOPA